MVPRWAPLRYSADGAIAGSTRAARGEPKDEAGSAGRSAPMGDASEAEMSLAGAAAVFERLAAAPDLTRVEQWRSAEARGPSSA